MRINISLLLLVFFLFSCSSDSKKVTKDLSEMTKAEKRLACYINSNEPTLIGGVETIYVNKIGNYSARIDTGAKTISIHATEIKKIVKDGEDYVSFKVHPTKSKSIHLEKKIIKTAKIRSASAKHERYFVMMEYVFEGNKQEILTNLNDRSRMTYKLLLGRNFLRGMYKVDGSNTHYLKYRTLTKELDLSSIDCSNKKYEFKEIGAIENIQVDGKYSLKTRIDTGAERTAIHATDIKVIKKNGKKYVSFKTLDDSGKEYDIEKPLVKIANVTSATSKSDKKRYVVSYNLGLDGETKRVEASLVDRAHLKFKMLIGRDFTDKDYAVDVSKIYIY